MNPVAALGVHLVAELDRCEQLGDCAAMERLLAAAAAAGHARLLAVHLHAFGGGGGVAGVALLAESHIAVHTWPEFAYAAVDVFMCGPEADPDAALAVLAAGLGAGRVRAQRLSRQAESAPATRGIAPA
jgi:S-adenosylmethionine decarboxylase